MFHPLPPPYLIKLATGKNVLLLFALFMSFTAGIMPAMEADIKILSGGIGVMDLEFYYTPEKALQMLNAYGHEGIRLYLVAQWTADLVFPLIGGVFFATFLIWAGARRWFWLGPCMMVADWIENVFLTVLLVEYPAFQPDIAVAGSVFTSIKWILIGLMNVIILFHLGKKLMVRFWRTGQLQA